MFTTKQGSGLKIFLDTKRWAIVVVSIEDDEAVFVLFIVVDDDDRVSSVPTQSKSFLSIRSNDQSLLIVKQVRCSLSIILISAETMNGRV